MALMPAELLLPSPLPFQAAAYRCALLYPSHPSARHNQLKSRRAKDNPKPVGESDEPCVPQGPHTMTDFGLSQTYRGKAVCAMLQGSDSSRTVGAPDLC